ncbi:zinc ribbon domain-containing protein [Haliangium ochraceum]|uniref:DZANK-type domain-containing protein n=1 Tax=Haliangium ochraceum (strain DSM 14365 / JCM 11303 / SMP-2) TaxID=502025 RepID=D0LWP3_HALO1|nr:zinc ribbon domain-containing protein [Haliangium ochraceum]ACY17693.1 hypothetical protein Hoch_5207 [Haliangium ochraceum DSM 14365]
MSQPSYEMLWDCAFCGQKALLGVTHRHCPTCGAAQEAESRYFPAPGQEVLAQEHVFSGADRHCPACHTPMGAAVEFCTKCGSPMDGAASVATHSEAPPEPAKPAKPKGKRRWPMVLLIIGVIVVALVMLFRYKSEGAVTVHGSSWERSIAVEEPYQAEERKECDKVPRGAVIRGRSEESRKRKIEDGEECVQECKDVRVDQGDGTFRVDQKCKEKCTKKYRTEQYYVTVCRYEIERWRNAREKVAKGSDLAPAWPEVALKGREREGKRTQVYRIELADDGGERFPCELKDEATWSKLAGEKKLLLDKNVLGQPRCETLRPVK